MIINREKSFLFIHVPKTGGISVRNVLGKVEGSETVRGYYHADIESAKEYIGEGFEKLFSFGFIRNPWSWVISTFEIGKLWAINDEYTGSYKDKVGLTYTSEMSLEEYISLFEEGENRTPLDWFLLDGKIEVKKIFRLEDLVEIGKKEMKDLLGREVKFLKLNNRRSSLYSPFYNEDMKKKIEKIFYREIEIGSYKF